MQHFAELLQSVSDEAKVKIGLRSGRSVLTTKENINLTPHSLWECPEYGTGFTVYFDADDVETVSTQ